MPLAVEPIVERQDVAVLVHLHAVGTCHCDRLGKECRVICGVGSHRACCLPFRSYDVDQLIAVDLDGAELDSFAPLRVGQIVMITDPVITVFCSERIARLEPFTSHAYAGSEGM